MVSNLRIGGLASGIETDLIIKNLMKAARMPLERLKQQKQLLEWKQEAYREINRSLLSFRNTIFDMKLQSSYLAKKAFSSNESALTATGTATAAEGIYEIGIKRLAKGVTLISTGQVSEETETLADGSTRTRTLAEQFGLDSEEIITFTLQGSTRNSDGSFKEQEFSFVAGSSNIYDVVNAINAAGLGFKASYDNINNRFVIASPGTGASQRVKVVADPMNLSKEGVPESARFLRDCLRLDVVEDVEIRGQNAELTLAGVLYDSFESNSFTLLGVSMNLKQAPDNPDNPINVTINVVKDVDAVFNNIKIFVQAYNEIMDKINTKLNERKYQNYLPLTDEQKEAMSDREIELWEEKARSGLLSRDTLLQGVVFNIRTTMSAVNSEMNNVYNSLAALGITTASYHEGGKLYINETRLRQALETDIDGVMNYFTKRSGNIKGLANRLYDDISNAISNISSRSGSDATSSRIDNSFLGRRLKELDNRIENEEAKLVRMEERYWRQFIAMEKAISRMNAQSAWLAQQFNQ